MKIGEMAKMTGCQVVTIRYYEQQGLLPKPRRSEGNYRLYSPDDLERLQFIRHCRKHDMTLEEVRALLAYRDASHKDCSWVGQLLDSHIVNIDQQMRSLRQLKKYLQDLRRRCKGGGMADTCEILKSLGDVSRCGCGKQCEATAPRRRRKRAGVG